MKVNVPAYRLSQTSMRWLIGLAAFGAVLLLAGFIVAPLYTAANLLLVSFYLLGLGLAGLLFVSFQYVTAAGWSVGLRRIPEAMTAILPFAAVGILAVLIFFPALYPWTHATGHGGDASTSFKEFWLNRPFFLGRAFIYIVAWLLLAFAIVRTSRQQDKNADLVYTRRNTRLSALFLVVFGITVWLASYDWLMSLEPHWYSTIYGVYHFAGIFLSGLAAITGLLILLHRLGPMRGILTEDHLHDLGKLLFGMSIFWVYIWYCQYMLIWYVNNPEETAWYTGRLQGAWQPLFWVNVVLNWVVPFFVLMPRAAKRNAGILWKVCAVILVGRWLDLYMAIMPALYADSFPFSFWELGLATGAGALFLLVFFKTLACASLVPAGDPYLIESLHPTQEQAVAIKEGRHAILTIGWPKDRI